MLSSTYMLAVIAALAQWDCALVVGQGKVAPLLPEEFAANMIQNKFNHNGFVVNHTCAGTYYSSYSQQMIRSDCTATGYSSNNHSQPTPFTSNIFLSLLDFTKSPTLNTYFEMDNLVNKTKCSTYTTAWLPPPKATFLRDVKAAYAGKEITAEYGVCEKWSFTLEQLPRTVFTFYFDAFSTLVRYDFSTFSDPEQGNVGVTNLFYNVATGNKDFLPPTIFAGSGQCPNGTSTSRAASPFPWH